MSEEEKEAIWYCSEILNDDENDRDNWKIVENLIDKLQKEVEELKKELEIFNGIKKGTTIMFGAKTQYWRKDKIEKYYISKNKIRDKINELEKEKDSYFNKNGFVPSYIYTITFNNKIISILKELLGDDINGN